MKKIMHLVTRKQPCFRILDMTLILHFIYIYEVGKLNKEETTKRYRTIITCILCKYHKLLHLEWMVKRTDWEWTLQWTTLTTVFQLVANCVGSVYDTLWII